MLKDVYMSKCDVSSNFEEQEFKSQNWAFIHISLRCHFKICWCQWKKKWGRIKCPSIISPALKTHFQHDSSAFPHHLHLIKCRILVNVPTWAVARLMSRKPRDSRSNQNMVLRGWFDLLEEYLGVMTGSIGLWLCGRDRGGVERAMTGLRERGGEIVCTLIWRGEAYLLASQRTLLEIYICNDGVLVSLILFHFWGTEDKYEDLVQFCRLFIQFYMKMWKQMSFHSVVLLSKLMC